MGLCCTKDSRAQVVERGQGGAPAASVEELLRGGLAKLRSNLAAHHEDKAMVLEIIRMLFGFVRTTLLTNPRAPEFIGLAFMGLHLLSEGCPTRLSHKIGLALHKLAEPEQLSVRAWDDNFLDCADVFKKVDQHRKALKNDDGRAALAHLGALADLAGEDEGGVTSQVDEAALSTYKELQRRMLQVLELLCDMVDGLLNEDVKNRFQQLSSKPPNYLEDLKSTLAIVTTIVKVFEPSSEADNSLQLLAVMGPESYGKSTLINHLIHRGRNIDFMPATPGMGTQVVCKIASGVLETLQTTSDTVPRTGSVKDMVEEVNSLMRYKSEAQAQKGEVLGIRDMEMLLATVPFEAPFRVEFLDVPGTKDTTIFHTRVALGLATSLVLVCGRIDDLKAQLSTGCLRLLKTAVAGLSQPIPIQCLVSFRVKESDFNSNRNLFTKVLQESFPSCKHLIKEPLFMNFFEAKDDAQRQEMADSFFTVMGTGRRHVIDPYERFLRLQPEIDEFTQALDKFFRVELADYFSNQIKSPEGAVCKVRNRISAFLANGSEHPAILDEIFDTSKIQKQLENVTIGSLPVFEYELMDKGTAQVRNAALVAQSLLNECRICQMGWLKDCSDDFHRRTLGDVFTDLSLLTASSSPHAAQLFNERLCATFRFCNMNREGSGDPAADPQGSELWWTETCISQIAPYLDSTALGCLLAGFYLICGDAKNKHDFLGQFRGKDVLIDEALSKSNKWKEEMIGRLDQVNYEHWIDACKEEAGNAEQVARALFASIAHASGEFAQIATRSGFLDETRGNFAIEALVDIIFVLMERIFIHVPEASLGDYAYTRFSEHLRTASASAELRKQAPLIRGDDSEKVHAACCEALRLMKQSDRGSSKWAAMLRDGVLEQQIAEMQKLRGMLAPAKFTPGQDRAMVLVSDEDRKVIMQTSVNQSPTHPIAAAALPILEQRCNSKALAGEDGQFPSLALREIRHSGARVAIFMRRGDQASYDPLQAESLLIEKLQGEPNLVTLFVLWTPVHAGTPWNTDHYTQRWNGNPKSSLEVCLVPMDESFDCQGFVDQEVADAILQAGTKAVGNLTRVREQELELRMNFVKEVEDFDADGRSSLNRDAKAFHKAMIEEMRPLLRKELQSVEVPRELFFIPTGAFNQAQYYVKTLDQVHVKKHNSHERVGGTTIPSPATTKRKEATSRRKEEATTRGEEAAIIGEEASTVNELECRSFNFHVLLGQCMSKCKILAAEVHDKVVARILDEIGAKEFFMSGSQIAQELEVFCRRNNDKGEFKKEVHNLDLLKLMITKEPFQHMYVGCVTYLLMPALYATVLPVLFKEGRGAEEEPTAENYKAHMERAKSMLARDLDSKVRSRRRGLA